MDDLGHGSGHPVFDADVCPYGRGTLAPDCGQDEPVRPLWWRQRATADAAWGEWQKLSEWQCPEDLVPAFTVADLRRLELPAPALSMQPARGWVLVQMDTIVYSTQHARTYRTSLLGHPLTVVARPHTYTWDFGDGTRTTTLSPGHAYPDQDVTHVYHRLGTRQITLTVTWTATYRYDEYESVHDVDGTATTTATSEPFTVEERRAHLVTQTCDQNPDAPGC